MQVNIQSQSADGHSYGGIAVDFLESVRGRFTETGLSLFGNTVHCHQIATRHDSKDPVEWDITLSIVIWPESPGEARFSFSAVGYVVLYSLAFRLRNQTPDMSATAHLIIERRHMRSGKPAKTMGYNLKFRREEAGKSPLQIPDMISRP